MTVGIWSTEPDHHHLTPHTPTHRRYHTIVPPHPIEMIHDKNIPPTIPPLFCRLLLLLPLLEDAAVDQRLHHKLTQWRGDRQSDCRPQWQRHAREREEARAEGGDLLLFEQSTC